LGTKTAKAITSVVGSEDNRAEAIFKIYSPAPQTSRDNWAYDFNKNTLREKAARFIEVYNGEIDRWQRRGDNSATIDNFVIYDDTKIKWSEGLKFNLKRNNYAKFNEQKIRISLYRPFCKQWAYFDRILNERVYQFPHFFPSIDTELENAVIWLKVGSEWPMFALITNTIPKFASSRRFTMLPLLHLLRRWH
jgi:predicted helicase